MKLVFRRFENFTVTENREEPSEREASLAYCPLRQEWKINSFLGVALRCVALRGGEKELRGVKRDTHGSEKP